MITVKGTYNTALCYCAQLDEKAARQIAAVCSEKAFHESKIRIMPDVHAGRGCTIGTAMTLTDRVVPAMVGVDIGCGMETVRVEQTKLDFAKLDALIHAAIPCGRAVRRTAHPLCAQIDLGELRCARHVNLERAQRSIGTLGGGNHFIEVDRGERGEVYLVVHSGSRHIGSEVAQYYQTQAARALQGGAQFQLRETIARLKAEGRAQEIEATVRALSEQGRSAAAGEELACADGALFEDYIHDMRIIQRFAALNRRAMTETILDGMGLTKTDAFTTVHNYIDTQHMVLRKGAVSAQRGERLLIPINMRDGSLICTGLGNEDWNCSAPHGAGRLMSRSAARGTLSLEEYRGEMAGVYTTCVTRDTLDESPMAYKSLEEIVSQIGPTAEIAERIRPLYNFKAAE